MAENNQYTLHFHKDTLELIIEPYARGFHGKCTDEVLKFNDCIFTCSDRKKLRTKAQEIRAVWLSKAKLEVERIEQLKVKNKY